MENKKISLNNNASILQFFQPISRSESLRDDLKKKIHENTLLKNKVNLLEQALASDADKMDIDAN